MRSRSQSKAATASVTVNSWLERLSRVRSYAARAVASGSPDRPASSASARSSASRMESLIPCVVIGSLKYPASPTSAQPGPQQRRRKPGAPAQPRRLLAGVAAATRSTKVGATTARTPLRSEEHTSELQSRQYLVCRLLLEKKKQNPLVEIIKH